MKPSRPLYVGQNNTFSKAACYVAALTLGPIPYGHSKNFQEHLQRSGNVAKRLILSVGCCGDVELENLVLLVAALMKGQTQHLPSVQHRRCHIAGASPRQKLGGRSFHWGPLSRGPLLTLLPLNSPSPEIMSPKHCTRYSTVFPCFDRGFMICNRAPIGGGISLQRNPIGFSVSIEDQIRHVAASNCFRLSNDMPNHFVGLGDIKTSVLAPMETLVHGLRSSRRHFE